MGGGDAGFFEGVAVAEVEGGAGGFEDHGAEGPDFGGDLEAGAPAPLAAVPVVAQFAVGATGGAVEVEAAGAEPSGPAEVVGGEFFGAFDPGGDGEGIGGDVEGGDGVVAVGGSGDGAVGGFKAGVVGGLRAGGGGEEVAAVEAVEGGAGGAAVAREGRGEADGVVESPVTGGAAGLH